MPVPDGAHARRPGGPAAARGDRDAGDAPAMAWSDDVAAVVVVAAEGYPGAYAKGEAIGGWRRQREAGVE